ncbi:MAG: hypothetical protein ABSH10_05785 [Phycisphaerae bacterium]|jgi:hypothetical protein
MTMKYLMACVALAVAAGFCGCSDMQSGELLPPVRSGGNDSDAAFSILLQIVPGEAHVKNAAALKDEVAAASGWNDVFVVHKAGWSELYHGHYASMDQAQSDLKKTKAWRDAAGAQPFAKAMIMALPGKDIGPPEWNLLRARGMFTVTVAEFYDVPEAAYVGRKDFAVRCCREFRSQGLESYYYHGPVKSFVCIGAFPESSYPSVYQNGRMERAVKDDRMAAIMKRFLYLAVNGRQEILVVGTKTGKPARLATASYVMEIPRQEDNTGAGSFGRASNPQSR